MNIFVPFLRQSLVGNPHLLQPVVRLLLRLVVVAVVPLLLPPQNRLQHR